MLILQDHKANSNAISGRKAYLRIYYAAYEWSSREEPEPSCYVPSKQQARSHPDKNNETAKNSHSQLLDPTARLNVV